MVPILLRVTEPMSIPRRLELSQLAHVDVVTVAKGQQLSKFILSRRAIEINYQAARALADIPPHTRNPREPFEEGSFIIGMKEYDPSIHVGQRKG